MDTKKVVIRVYGQNTIIYGGDVVVEAPQGMDEEVIAEVVVSHFHCIPEPHWKEQDEEGVTLNDDTPDIIGVADNAEEPSVRLTETKDGEIRLYIREKHDG
jgi:hypothetical protein